jgi:selenocysteine-specific translation elongation factor
MIEKHNEHGLDLHMLFIDFKQAFDSINRERLFAATDKMGIPEKLIRLTRMTMCQTKARVKIDNQIGALLNMIKESSKVMVCRQRSSSWHYTMQHRM